MTIFSTFIILGVDINEQWLHIKNILISIIDAKTPIKQIRMKTNNKSPWIDKELICLGKKRDRVYNKARKTKQKEQWNLYKTFRNKYATLFKEKRKKL